MVKVEDLNKSEEKVKVKEKVKEKVKDKKWRQK